MGRILVADDHDSLRRGIVRALSEAKHEVDEAPNCNIAIHRLHQRQYEDSLTALHSAGLDRFPTHPTSKIRSLIYPAIPTTTSGTTHTKFKAINLDSLDI